MANHTGAERRRFPRLAVSLIVDYSVSKTASIARAQTRDISAGGICLVVYEDIKAGTVLELKIYLPDNASPIAAKGKVIWKTEFSFSSDSKSRFDMGIEFSEIGESDRQKISLYISSLSSNK